MATLGMLTLFTTETQGWKKKIKKCNLQECD